jgi:hypothetical protein
MLVMGVHAYVRRRVLTPTEGLRLCDRASTDAILVNAGIEWCPFSEAAMAELPHVPNPALWRVDAAELAVRRDLRGPENFICSIDPPGMARLDFTCFCGAGLLACGD